MSQQTNELRNIVVSINNIITTLEAEEVPEIVAENTPSADVQVTAEVPTVTVEATPPVETPTPEVETPVEQPTDTPTEV